MSVKRSINRREFMRRSGFVTAGTVALRSSGKVVWASARLSPTGRRWITKESS